jgi:thiamine kinase-like enzyme
LLEDPAAWATPLARGWLPDELFRPLLEMRHDQESFLISLERTPQTVCRFDLHPANLFGRVDETVLIDWSFVGIGAIGEDAGNLVSDSVLDFHVRPEHIGDLYDMAYDGYLAGLRDAGWAGSGEIIDLAMRALIAAKYAWIAPAMLRAALDRRESLNKWPIEEAFGWWAPVIPFLLRCGEEARRLMGIVT